MECSSQGQMRCKGTLSGFGPSCRIITSLFRTSESGKRAGNPENWFITLKNRALSASTMVEMLVVMLLTTVVVALVVDGLGLFSRYTLRTAEQVTVNNLFYRDYSTLEALVGSSDSIVVSDAGWLLLYRDGELCRVLRERDSSLLVQTGKRVDTLMKSLVVLSPVCNGRRPEWVDTLAVKVRRRNKPDLRIAFPVESPTQARILKILEEQEKNYRYE